MIMGKTESLVLDIIAEQIHGEWVYWSKSLVSSTKINPVLAGAWKTMWIPYEDLSVELKRPYKRWARNLLQLLSFVSYIRLDPIQLTKPALDKDEITVDIEKAVMSFRNISASAGYNETERIFRRLKDGRYDLSEFDIVNGPRKAVELGSKSESAHIFTDQIEVSTPSDCESAAVDKIDLLGDLDMILATVIQKGSKEERDPVFYSGAAAFAEEFRVKIETEYFVRK